MKSYENMSRIEFINDMKQFESMFINSKNSDKKEHNEGQSKFYLRESSDKKVGEKKKKYDKFPETEEFERLNVMAGGIAHNFNNILTGIMGFAELAEMDLSPDSPTKENIEEIIKLSRRGAKLTKELLLYMGAVPFTFKVLQLSEAVRETVKLMELSINKNCRLICHLSEDLPSLEGDVTQIKQIIINLFINASEAIGEKEGIITVRTGAIEFDETYRDESYSGEKLSKVPYVYLEVADTGCGIPEEIQNKIFDPFFSTRFVGRGLGLSSVMGIVRSHKGAIRVKSDPEWGTEIRVFFPAVKKACKHKDNIENRNDIGIVLVVDEEKSYLNTARSILERAGFTVMTVSCRNKAVDMFRFHSDKISTVILDVAILDISGKEILHEFYNIRNDIRLLLSVDYNKENSINPSADCDPAGFIRKPYLINELIEAVKK